MGFFSKEKKFYKTFFTLTITIALQNVIVYGVNLADNVMIGGFSETALSGVALVNQIQFFLQMIIMGTGEGIVVLASRYWGKKDIESIKKIISVGMRIGVIAALALWAAVFFFPTQILGMLINDSSVIAEGTGYLRVVCFSYLFFAITNILLASLRSVETVKIGFLISLSTLIINVFLNYTLIYGNFGAARMGAVGAAIATLTARIIEFIIVFIYVKRIDKKIMLKFKELLKIDMVYFKQYMKISSPVIMSNGIWGIAMAAQTSILGHLGGSAIPANSIASTVFSILTVFSYGSSSATNVVIGKTIGEGKINKVKEYTRTMQIIYIGIGILTGLGLFLAKDIIIDFYSVTEETRKLALQFMNILSITVVGTSYQVPCLTGIVRGGGDTKFVLFNDLIFMWLIVLPASYLAAFTFKLSPSIVFMCLKSDQILKCFVVIVKVNRYKWIRKI